ncbi:MAG: glycosyl hydrolase, partial [Mangrovibacterium sp.]
DLGIDLANASGWPFGGPWISGEYACRNVQFRQYALKEGERLSEKVEMIQQPQVRAVGHRVDISRVKYPVSSNPDLQKLALDQVRFELPLPLQTLMAYSDRGDTLELTGKVGADGTLGWTAPAGNWQLYAVFQGWHGKQVERAGKGGEGNVIDHFSEEATLKFLNRFDENLGDIDISSLRAFFNDSYEVDDASGESDWTPLFFEEFRQRRGYELKLYLPALFGNDSEEMNSRVLCDYRETISDLLLDRFTKVWADWSAEHQALIRNQAHGSPANILDLYAASDIPETEGTQFMRIKMASSAGHVTGKPLIACEAATWLNEHFRSTLSDVKQNLDRYLANGVNHIVYHGTPYSPVKEPWPGWQFYAAVHFAPTNTWWNDLSAINAYVTRCQSFMQKSVPANDILMYFPIFDSWSEQGRSRLVHFGGAREPLTEQLSGLLLKKGFTFDYISDRQIAGLSAKKGIIRAKGADYRTILIPSCEYMPLATLEKLIALAEDGARVIFQDHLPVDVPGLADLKKRQQSWQELIASLAFKPVAGIKVASYGKGQVLLGNHVPGMLAELGIFPEELAELGLWFNRVKRTEGICYLISNWSDRRVDQWVPLQLTEKQAAWFDPMSGQIRKARLEKTGRNRSRVYLQLEPGETRILQAYPYPLDLPEMPVWEASGTVIPLEGEWTVSFLCGGPALPASYTTTRLESWTGRSDELKEFSGTASYQIRFAHPSGEAEAWELDLGRVCESAVVWLNGQKLGTLVGPVWKLKLDASLLQESNELEVCVTNLMANRIIGMDKRGEPYKKFYNINFAAHERENAGPDGLFTAAGWDPLESGLMGPVILRELKPLIND